MVQRDMLDLWTSAASTVWQKLMRLTINTTLL